MDNTVQHKSEGHRKRLRDKFLVSGLVGFHDYEVIEMLLSLATPRKDCKDSAKKVLKKYKTLQGVFEASTEELCTINGIGPVNAFGIRLVREAAERYLEKKIIGKKTLNNSKALFDYLYHHLRDKSREHFKAIFLDAKNRIISTETLCKGTLTMSSVYPREVIRAAINHQSAALIFAHNHPSGDPNPSQEDLSITQKLIFACRIMGITVHEHLIIGDNKYYSFADQGLISTMNREYDTRDLKFSQRKV